VRKNQTSGALALAGFDDIFNAGTPGSAAERVTEIPLSELHPPEFHPCQVNDDEAMTRLAQSVKQYGVREPGLARKRADDGHELLCGNRRKRACELAGITAMPVIIRELDDGTLTGAGIEQVISEEKKLTKSKPTLTKFSHYFPDNYSPEQMESVITELLTGWRAGLAARSEGGAVQC
jgi:ParB family chromosome partitioning protein